MSDVFEYAIEFEYIDYNPVKKIKRPKNKGAHKNPFKEHEIPLIVSNVSDPYALGYEEYIKARFATGVRTQEINALETKHFDTKNRLLKIGQAIVFVKKSKELKRGKTRIVELNDVAYDALKDN